MTHCRSGTEYELNKIYHFDQRYSQKKTGITPSSAEDSDPLQEWDVVGGQDDVDATSARTLSTSSRLGAIGLRKAKEEETCCR